MRRAITPFIMLIENLLSWKEPFFKNGVGCIGDKNSNNNNKI